MTCSRFGTTIHGFYFLFGGRIRLLSHYLSKTSTNNIKNKSLQIASHKLNQHQDIGINMSIPYNSELAFNISNGYTLFVIDQILQLVQQGNKCCTVRPRAKVFALKWFQHLNKEMREMYDCRARQRTKAMFLLVEPADSIFTDINGTPFKQYNLCAECLAILEVVADMSLAEPAASSYRIYRSLVDKGYMLRDNDSKKVE